MTTINSQEPLAYPEGHCPKDCHFCVFRLNKEYLKYISNGITRTENYDTVNHGIFTTVKFCVFFDLELFVGGNFYRFLTHGKVGLVGGNRFVG